VDRETTILWAVLLGSLCYAVLLTLAIECRGAKSPVDGMQVGAVVGFLLWGTADFVLFGNTNLSTLTGATADAVLEGIRGGITGAIIVLVLSKVGD